MGCGNVRPVLTNDQLVDLFTLGATPWAGAFRVAPPTAASVRRINATLKIELPDAFVAFADKCADYGVWFAGIGKDYDNPLHILRLNQSFHAGGDSEPNNLPDWLVLFNHGHDGDCDCFDLRTRTPTGEHPLLYYSVSESSQPQPPFEPITLAPNFHDYLTALATRMAKDEERNRRKRRAKNRPH